MKAERADAPARIDRMAPASSTVNDAARMSTLLDWGVDGIVTDVADVALDVVATRSSTPPRAGG